MIKKTIPPCFKFDGTHYRFIRVEIEGEHAGTVKAMLIDGGLSFFYLNAADVLARGKEIAEPDEKDSTYF